MRLKDKKVKTELFYCPDCDRYLELPVAVGRKRCPACSNKHNHEKIKKNSRERYASMTEEEKAAFLKAKQEKKADVSQPTKTPEELEEELRYNTQRKQCVKCRHWTNDGANQERFCHYYLRYGVGHRRDKGNGPGDCRSFDPRRKRTYAEQRAYAKAQLLKAEADHYAQQPRKEEKENATR